MDWPYVIVDTDVTDAGHYAVTVIDRAGTKHVVAVLASEYLTRGPHEAITLALTIPPPPRPGP